MTSSMGGLGSDDSRGESESVDPLQAVNSPDIKTPRVPLESSFLNFCVVAS